jgi:hypothetical protein
MREKLYGCHSDDGPIYAGGTFKARNRAAAERTLERVMAVEDDPTVASSTEYMRQHIRRCWHAKLRLLARKAAAREEAGPVCYAVADISGGPRLYDNGEKGRYAHVLFCWSRERRVCLHYFL